MTLTPAHWFLASVATYMVPNGIQMVLLPYLLAIELNQSADRFGLTQMVGQLPLLLFLLVGGWVADRVDTRRWLMTLQTLALLMPVVLIAYLWHGQAQEWVVLAYAVAWGLVAAFSLPARDGLLKRVSGLNVQRMVILAIGVQFAAQMVGQSLAALASRWGATPLLAIQVGFIVAGIFVASRLPSSTRSAPSAGQSLWRELLAGLNLMRSQPVLRATLVITIGMGVFFGGVFFVLMPLAVRDLYSGGAVEISAGYVAFALGTLLTIVTLARRGGVRRPGRALLLSQCTGCLSLLPIVFGPPMWLFFLCIFCWGCSGGMAMTMSRTIMQEQSPATHQARVMAVMSMATAGGGPLGAFLTGQLVAAVGVQAAAIMPIVGVLSTTLASLLTFSIVNLRSSSQARS